jgi:uncharacterized protein YndB with AHSA1/START domain
MTDQRVDHGSFRIERSYDAPPKHVFAAWATEAEKDRWFGAGDDFLTHTDEYTLDFAVGRDEHLVGTLPNGRRFRYDATYLDIVDDVRIVSAYAVSINERRTSVSLMTVELNEEGGGTRLVLTEQGAFLDGLDSNDQREEGARDSLDTLARHLLRREPVGTPGDA